MRKLAILLSFCLVGCSLGSVGCSNPMNPSSFNEGVSNGQGIKMPDSLRNAFILADYKGNVKAKEIRFASLNGISGRYLTSERIVEINESLKGQDDRVLAGIIAHELHHSAGYLHDCADGIRDRDSKGAWEIHAITLDRLGVEHSIRENQFCG